MKLNIKKKKKPLEDLTSRGLKKSVFGLPSIGLNHKFFR